MAVAQAEENPPGNLPAAQVNAGLPAEAEPETQGQEAIAETAFTRGVNNFNNLSRGRQIQLIIAVASVLALIAMITMWSTAPTYKLLYGKLTEEAAGEIIPILQQEDISYKLDEKTGELMVPADRVHDVRIMLAAKGLPKSDGSGYEMLDEQQGFGTSQFMEAARYHRAMEGELARSISQLENVESARVHLAIPKESVFVRNRQEPSASVLVNLRPGRSLDESQVAAIVHMVAAATPRLKSEHVTVVDQTGKMLTRRDMPGEMGLSAAQFDYKRKMEDSYTQRIERILSPIVGFEGVRAQVDADLDFSVVEKTEESYNPDLPALRSEQTVEEQSKGGDAGGVPGALTNQPPGVATSPEKLPDQNGKTSEPPSRSSRRATYNYELDKTIAHTRMAPGEVKRLSVAVVLDDKTIVDAAGNVTRTPLTPEELDRLTGLVKEAVGFNAQRGDSLNVINASFQSSQPMPVGPTGPVWEQPWFIDTAKQVAGVLAVLLLIYMMLRPVLRDLTRKEEEPELAGLLGQDGPEAIPAEEDEELRKAEWAKRFGADEEEYNKMLQVLRDMVKEDPKLVAQVIKTWVAADE